MANLSNVTERQAKYFASLRAGLEASTGRTFDEWVSIARSCPESGRRARLTWFKERHGLLQNRASMVIDAAFGEDANWSDPDALLAGQWADPRSRAVFETIDAVTLALPGVVRTVRKSYTAWSRRVQFAAARPLRTGGVMLGLAAPPDTDPRLRPRGSESWSERLLSKLPVDAPGAVDKLVLEYLRQGWEGA